MIIHNSLYDDLCREIDSGTPEERIGLLLRGIASRIQAADANPVKLSDLMSILRENPDKLANTVLRKNHLKAV
ncbi:hypothetical protein QY049_03280 [Bradyrhizobium sp. WYCCWR 13022]|uniref:hypothetical protein n=1 Tax=unclassified Bradyrhizobium TaxID=2631580 RepID=UPI00263ABA6F|nr:hypothetical protein [Bradyrhizobium sp. WYCCWR 13022]MDN4982248.1 hypothetical protein [Bradyrhizobium sp. WYCCWR 13022]